MKLIIRIAVSAIFCLFILSPNSFADNTAKADLLVAIPLEVHGSPTNNHTIPLLLRGQTITVDDYPRPLSLTYTWVVLGTKDANVKLTFPEGVQTDNDGITMEMYWECASQVHNQDIVPLSEWDESGTRGKYEFYMSVTWVHAGDNCRFGPHTVMQTLSVTYYGS